jgi:hypothetical protein
MKALLALALAACQGTTALCVDTVLCAQNAHWDPSKCMCVAHGDGGCVQNVACSAQAYWDPVRCACVANGGTDMGCVQNVFCSDSAHWDPLTCMCVVNAASDMASSCSSVCSGGTPGCPRMCSGCTTGQLCCPWAGGACLPTDAGCMSNGGFQCATATPAGLCPDQCFP